MLYRKPCFLYMYCMWYCTIKPYQCPCNASEAAELHVKVKPAFIQ